MKRKELAMGSYRTGLGQQQVQGRMMELVHRMMEQERQFLFQLLCIRRMMAENVKKSAKISFSRRTKRFQITLGGL
jgi:hypothetical protein